MGERGFAGAGRAVKKERLDAVGLNRAAEKLAGAEDVRLTGVFVEVARAHPCGERLAAECVGRGGAMVRRQVFCRGGKQFVVGHAASLTEDEDEDEEDRAHFNFRHPYEVTGRSLLLFLLRPAKAARE